MSEIVTIDSVVISLIYRCPKCKFTNIANKSHMPVASTVVNDEVELFYLDTCKQCSTENKIGIVATSE